MNKLRSNLAAVRRRLRCLVSWSFYRWKTRKEWWVVIYETKSLNETERGSFASLEKTREGAMSDARELLEKHTILSGVCSYTVRRPNIIDLFFS